MAVPPPRELTLSNCFARKQPGHNDGIPRAQCHRYTCPMIEIKIKSKKPKNKIQKIQKIQKIKSKNPKIRKEKSKKEELVCESASDSVGEPPTAYRSDPKRKRKTGLRVGVRLRGGASGSVQTRSKPKEKKKKKPSLAAIPGFPHFVVEPFQREARQPSQAFHILSRSRVKEKKRKRKSPGANLRSGSCPHTRLAARVCARCRCRSCRPGHCRAPRPRVAAPHPRR